MKRLILIALFFTLAFLLKSVVSANAYAAETVRVTLDNRDGAVNTSVVVDIYKTVSGSPSLMVSYYSPVARYTTSGTGQAIVQYTSSTDSAPYTIRWSNPYCGGGGTGTAVLNSTSGSYEITRSVRCTTVNSIVNMSTISCATTTETGSVSWNVSNNNGGYPNISGFRVYKALSGSSFGTTFQSVAFTTDSNQTTPYTTTPYSANLTGLSTGVWVVRVVAVPNNPDQANITVNDVNLACGTAVIPPTAPNAVYSSCNSTNSNVAITWNGATPGTFTYKVEILDQSGNTDLGPVSWAGVSGVTSVDQSAGINLANTTLASNHSYFAHVVATETGGAKYYSTTSSFTVPTTCSGAGGGSGTVPYNLSVVQTCDAGSPQVTFSWDPDGPTTNYLEVTTNQFTGDGAPQPDNIPAAFAYYTETGSAFSRFVWGGSGGGSLDTRYGSDANPQTPTTLDNGIPIAGETYYWRISKMGMSGLSKYTYMNGTNTNGVYSGTAAWSGVPFQLTACTSQPYHDVKVEVEGNLKVAGAVTSIAIANSGSGYTDPVVTISGGGGSGAIATASINDDGAVTAIAITNSGSGYTSAPTVAISGGGGIGANLAATFGDVDNPSRSFEAGQTVTFKARVTNLNVNSGTALPAGNKLYLYYIGGGAVPNCINTLNNNAQTSVPTDGASPAQQQEYSTQTILGSDNGSAYIDVKYNVGSTVGSKTAHLYAIPSCTFPSPDDTATDPNWLNNDASFGYTVGIDKFFQTTGGDVGASGSRAPYGKTIKVGVNSSNPNRCNPVCSVFYQSSYGIIANELTNDVSSAGFQINGYGQRGLVSDGGVYAYFANKFKAKATIPANTMAAPCILSASSSGFYYCNTSLTVNSITTITNTAGPAVFFIDGDLNINADLKLNGASDAAVYIVSGNITVSSTTPVRNLHGIFIAKGTFNDCTALCSVAATTDALTIQGALYVDGSLNLSRYFSTAESNNSNPSDIINFEPKYLKVLNSLLASSDVGWKETAP